MHEIRGGNFINNFFFVTGDVVNQARAFVRGKLFQTGVIFVGKDRSLSKVGALDQTQHYSKILD